MLTIYALNSVTYDLRDTYTCLTTAWLLCGQPQTTATGLFVLGISVTFKIRAFSGAAMLPRFYSSRTQTTALPNYSKRSQMTKGSYQPDRLISNANSRSNRDYVGHFRWRLTSSEKRGGTWTLPGRGESSERKLFGQNKWIVFGVHHWDIVTICDLAFMCNLQAWEQLERRWYSGLRSKNEVLAVCDDLVTTCVTTLYWNTLKRRKIALWYPSFGRFLCSSPFAWICCFQNLLCRNFTVRVSVPGPRHPRYL